MCACVQRFEAPVFGAKYDALREGRERVGSVRLPDWCKYCLIAALSRSVV
jgi:hypothetical protein